MRVLLDECTPRPLARELADVNAVHVHDLGWHGRRNGALLAAMLAEGFTALVTVDRNLSYEQNIPVSGVVVIVLRAARNWLSDLRPLLREVRRILASAVPGEGYLVERSGTQVTLSSGNMLYTWASSE